MLRLMQGVELFHASDMTAFADIDINGHRETWPVKSKTFSYWLARAFYQETHSAAGSEAIQATLNVIEAKARHDAIEREAHVRTARLDGKLYIDLGDKAWCAIEIDTDGWRVVDAPPVRFKRASGALELPVPVSGGSIEDLRPFFNLRNNRDFILVVAWALAALIDTGPYPVLAFTGEQGVAKSTASKIFRTLIDPNGAPLRALPRSDRELFISASNSHLLVFDNVSGLQPWLSDTLCRLSSGGGFAVRSLFTNTDEVVFNASRPIILNGIGDIITRPDLAARALFIGLEPISDADRKAEVELLAELDAKRPQILGVLLDAISLGLRLHGHQSSFPNCRGWPTSPSGRPPVRRLSGPQGPSWPPTMTICSRWSTPSLKPIWWARRCVCSQKSGLHGPAPLRSFWTGCACSPTKA